MQKHAMTDFSYIPTVDLQNAIDTLKAERLGWWRLKLSEEHLDEIDEAHKKASQDAAAFRRAEECDFIEF